MVFHFIIILRIEGVVTFVYFRSCTILTKFNLRSKLVVVSIVSSKLV